MRRRPASAPAAGRRRRLGAAGRSAVAAAVLAAGCSSVRPDAATAETAPTDPDAVARGEYIYHAAGCAGCHTDRENEGPELGGGVALDTPYGTFHAPNISPHPEHGIGGWSDADFVRALREGEAPDGTPYYPAFPYTSYTGMTDRDILDLKAYIFAQEPAGVPSRGHDLRFPYNMRFMMEPWQALFLDEGPFEPDPGRSETWNRGAYLVEALAHCGECHTPRNFAGALEREMWLAGTPDGAEGEPAPNITPDPETGIGDWSKDDLMFMLEIGMLPDGDFVSGLMNTVVEESTSKLTPEDRAAIAEYVMSVPPIHHAVAGTKDGGAEEGAFD